MKRLLLILALIVLAAPVAALQWRYVKTATEVTVGASATDLFTDADVQEGSGHPQVTLATCSLTGANIRISYSGTDPTTSLGEVLTPGVYTITDTTTMLNLRGIRDDGTDATWNCILHGN